MTDDRLTDDRLTDDGDEGHDVHDSDDDGVITTDDIAFFMALHIESQRRIYDVVLAQLAAVAGAEKAKELQQMHEQGNFLYPPEFDGVDETL